jgi:hypothetical protein
MPIRIEWYKWRGNSRVKEKAYFKNKESAEKFAESMNEGEDFSFTEVSIDEVRG